MRKPNNIEKFTILYYVIFLNKNTKYHFLVIIQEMHIKKRIELFHIQILTISWTAFEKISKLSGHALSIVKKCNPISCICETKSWSSRLITLHPSYRCSNNQQRRSMLPNFNMTSTSMDSKFKLIFWENLLLVEILL